MRVALRHRNILVRKCGIALMRKTITTCPVCDGRVHVTHLECETCGTVLQGSFASCPFCKLPQNLYDFLTVFIQCEGVIREIEKEIGISYPAVKNRVRKLKHTLGMQRTKPQTQDEQTEQVLRAAKNRRDVG